MNKITAYTYILLITAIGCARKPENINPTSIPVIKYKNYDCSELSIRLKQVNEKIKSTIPIQENAANVDSVAAAGGIITIFAPVLFMSGGAHEQELSLLKGEVLAIEQSAKEKKCEDITAFIEK